MGAISCQLATVCLGAKGSAKCRNRQNCYVLGSIEPVCICVRLVDFAERCMWEVCGVCDVTFTMYSYDPM